MAVIVHYHRKGRQTLTLDLSPKTIHEQYEELVGQLMEILAKQATTHDDGQEGHPFYGNQYTDVVLGPKPTSANVKGVKNAVHELLSSGHPFDLDELKKATGAKLDQQLHNAMAELKKAGKLQIVKVGKQWQVVKPNGHPAPAAPIPDPIPAAKEPDPIQTPIEPEKTAGTAPPEAPIAQPALATMGKTEADQKYKADLHDASLKVGKSYLDGNIGENEAAEDWKKAKAQLMADWATAVKGVPHQPKLVSVFPADKTLVQDLALAAAAKESLQNEMVAKAISDWKSATAKAKQGVTAPAEPPPPSVKKEPVSPALAATPTGGHVLPAPDSPIVPDDHKHIDVSDFTGPSGYVKGISDLHDKLHSSASANAVANKKAIQDALSKRLKDSHHFQNMQAQFAKSGSASYGGSLAARLISAWAGSSGDHQPISVAAQLSIRDAFKMNPEHIETKAFHYLESHSEDTTHQHSAKALGIDVSTPEKLASYKEGMKDFALAQYHETQDHLAKLGVKELYLVRGMKIGNGSGGAKHVKVKLQPASSFTTAHSTAKNFAGGHSLFAVKVPASQVIGSFCTGYGCTSESEVVVLGHENLHAFQVGSGVGTSATAMASNIKSLHGAGVNQTAPKAKASTSKSSALPKFKPMLPAQPVGAHKKWVIKLNAAASSGDPQKIDDVIGEMKSTNLSLPKTNAYAKGLKEYVGLQHIAWLAQVQKQHAVSVTAPSASVPQKNAYYYKKLKEKILSSPMHTENNYTLLKAAGMTNEKVLEQYKKQYQIQYGAEHP